MKPHTLAACCVIGLAAVASAQDVTWTLTGPSQVNQGDTVTWQASVEVTGDNQGLAGYAFHLVVGTAVPGPSAGGDGRWGTSDDENLIDVLIPPARFAESFKVGGGDATGTVVDTGSDGGPGMSALPQTGNNTGRAGTLLQIGTSHLAWTAFPGADGQTAGVGLDAAKADLLADPAGDYVLNAGSIPTADLVGGTTYTALLVPVTARTLRSDLDFAADNTSFIAQSADTVGGAFDFTVGDVAIPGDFDNDGDVDETDLAVFIACTTGPTILYDPQGLPLGCELLPDENDLIEADFDDNGDVSQADFAFFQRCISGDGKPGDPTCAD